MNDKTGRPPLPKGAAKGIQIGVRFKPKDARAIDNATANTGQTKVDLIRDAAIAEAKYPPPWVSSKWTIDDLEGKKVQFRLTAPKFRVEGVGEFLVRKNPRGELAIEICAIKSATPCEVVESRFWICQEIADKIERNPEPKVATFRLIA